MQEREKTRDNEEAEIHGAMEESEMLTVRFEQQGRSGDPRNPNPNPNPNFRHRDDDDDDD